MKSKTDTVQSATKSAKKKRESSPTSTTAESPNGRKPLVRRWHREEYERGNYDKLPEAALEALGGPKKEENSV